MASDYYASEALPTASIVTSCPDWPANILTNGAKGNIITTPVQPYQGKLFLSQKLIPYSDGDVKTLSATIKGSKQDCQQIIRTTDEALSGWNIVLLNQWYTPVSGQWSRLANNIISALPGIMFIPLEENNAMQVKAFFQSNGKILPPTISGLQFGAYAKQYQLTTNPDITYSPYLKTTGQNRVNGVLTTQTLLNDIKKTLTANGWKQLDVGMIIVDGKWWPAIIKLFGKPGKVYAYYGRFTDGAEAKHYGYTTSDELYFSRRSLVPKEETEIFQPDIRYGSKIFKRDEVLQNRQFLEWHTECRCSDLPFNGDDRNMAKIESNNNWTPIAPDKPENSNPPMFVDCPDQRTYFTLYQTCVEKDLKENHFTPDPSGRINYSDYVASKVNASPVYKSVNPDGTIDHEDLSTDIMPETPAYYDKQGQRLNPSTEDFMDPFDANTVFYGFRHGPKSLFDWSGPKRNQYLINPKIHVVVNDMQSLFDSKINGSIVPLLNLFQITFDGSGNIQIPENSKHNPNEPLQAQANFASLELSITVPNPLDLNRPIKVLNASDKYLEYKSARTFLSQSLSGRPLRVQVWVNGRDWTDNLFGSNIEDYNFRVYWDYGLYAFNNHGDPEQVGTIHISNVFWRNSVDDGQNLVGEWMDEIHMEGGKLLSSADTYNLNSREAHTDLKSLHDRDPVTFEDKSEAVARIAYYIAVAEGLDMAMKWLYNQKDKPYIYESAKRLENMVAVKQSAKVAYAFYKSYIEWKRLMDILAEIRDSRRALERAYSRFKRSGGLLVDYFVNLEYSKIRPTNITMIYPTRAMRYFDWSANEFRNELMHFETSLHALNLDLDRFMDGPGKRTLAYIYRETGSSLAQIETINDRDRENTHKALKDAQAALGRGGDNTSNYIRLSSLTRLAIQKTRNTQVKSLEASTSGLRSVLIAIQSDSRDWLTMQDYVTHNLAGSPQALGQAYQDRDPGAISKQFDVHPVFKNTWVEDQLKEGEP